MITHPTEDLCQYCHKPLGWPAHRRDNGECMAFERAAVKPYGLRLRRVPAAASGWVLR